MTAGEERFIRDFLSKIKWKFKDVAWNKRRPVLERELAELTLDELTTLCRHYRCSCDAVVLVGRLNNEIGGMPSRKKKSDHPIKAYYG